MSIRNDTYVVNEQGTIDIVWAGILNGDSGLPVSIQQGFWKLSIQAAGTFGAAGSVALEGSNDGVNYSAIKDVNNTTVAMTDTSMWRVEVVSKFLRPRATAGDGTTALVISLHAVI